MNVFIYQAALYCEDCGRAIISELSTKADSGDSNDYPQGPHSNGGGEADSPQHCDACGEHLKNPLTSEGETYVKETVNSVSPKQRGRHGCANQWQTFYSYLF